MATDRRREKQADAVAREVASSGVRVESDSGYQAVLVEGRRVNHLLHFFVGIFTCGLWWLVWLFFGITGGERRYVVRTDEFGNTRVERPNSRPNPAIVAAVIGRRGSSVDPIAHGSPSHTVQRNSVGNMAG